MTCCITNNHMFTFNNQYISIVATIIFPNSFKSGKSREGYTTDKIHTFQERGLSYDKQLGSEVIY